MLQSVKSLVILLLLGDTVLTGLDLVEDLLVSSLEGLLQAVGETVEASGTHGLLLAADLASLLLDELGASSLAGLVGLGLQSSLGLAVGVKSLHHLLVLERVLLGLVVLTDGSADLAERVLDLVGVDDTGQVSASHHVAVEAVSTLLDTLDAVSSEHLVECLEGVLGEDHEATEMTSGGQLEQVEAVHRAGVDTGHVAGSSLEEGVLISVDEERALLEEEARVAHLAGTSAGSLSASASQVLGGTALLERGEERLGGLNVERVEHEGQLGDLVDLVAASLHEGSHSGGGEGRSDGVSLLVKVDLSVPLPPHLEGSEHASLAAHVSEGSLAGAVGSGALDTGNSRDGATSSPGLGGVLVTGKSVDTVGLSSVLGHVGVDELDDVITDGGGEDGGHGHRGDDFGGGFVRVHTDDGTGGHVS